MFTLKVEFPDGQSALHQFPLVTTTWDNRHEVGTPEMVKMRDLVVWGSNDDGGTVRFDEGTVYVMNENGKTVSVYHLRYPEPTVTKA